MRPDVPDRRHRAQQVGPRPGARSSATTSATNRSTPTTDALELTFRDTRPGVYIFTLPADARRRPDASKPPEYLATVFNIDTAREGPLQRAKGTDLDDQAKGAEVHSTDDTGWLDTLKQKQTDLSSGRWIYLVILLVLICEQAMAVRLSHHQRPEDLEAFAPSAAAAFAHGTPAARRSRGRDRRGRERNWQRRA